MKGETADWTEPKKKNGFCITTCINEWILQISSNIMRKLIVKGAKLIKNKANNNYCHD